MEHREKRAGSESERRRRQQTERRNRAWKPAGPACSNAAAMIANTSSSICNILKRVKMSLVEFSGWIVVVLTILTRAVARSPSSSSGCRAALRPVLQCGLKTAYQSTNIRRRESIRIAKNTSHGCSSCSVSRSRTNHGGLSGYIWLVTACFVWPQRSWKLTPFDRER